jgi:hypothetical protein
MSIANSLIEGFIREVKKDNNQRRLRDQILDPAARYLENSLKPYFFTLLIVLLLMTGVLLWILRIALSMKSARFSHD